MTSKIIFDNIHEYMEIKPLAKIFIDTPIFQRLRHIKTIFPQFNKNNIELCNLIKKCKQYNEDKDYNHYELCRKCIRFNYNRKNNVCQYCYSEYINNHKKRLYIVYYYNICSTSLLIIFCNKCLNFNYYCHEINSDDINNNGYNIFLENIYRNEYSEELEKYGIYDFIDKNDSNVNCLINNDS